MHYHIRKTDKKSSYLNKTFKNRPFFMLVFVNVFTLILISSSSIHASLSGPLDEQSIVMRIKPDAKVTIEGGASGGVAQAASTTVADVGQKIYEEVCKMCHETGLAGSPKLGNKADWAPRISQGIDTLIKHAIQGIKAMPPKGGCSTCSDDDIKKAVEYMLNKSK